MYPAADIPQTFTRQRNVARCAAALPAERVYVMDSGMAAIVGACQDRRARMKSNLIVMDIATSHTLAAAVQDGELFGFFEYHTRDVSREKLEKQIKRLADGDIDHATVLREGGHGAYLRKHFGFKHTDIILATGPKRSMMDKSRLPVVFGAPLGDTMLTGAAGLLKSLRIQPGQKN